MAGLFAREVAFQEITAGAGRDRTAAVAGVSQKVVLFADSLPLGVVAQGSDLNLPKHCVGLLKPSGRRGAPITPRFGDYSRDRPRVPHDVGERGASAP